MTEKTLVRYTDGAGTTPLVFTMEVKGNPDEPWNPVRAELVPLIGGDGLKAFKMGGALEEVPLDGRLVMRQGQPKKPAVNPLLRSVPWSRSAPSHIAFVTTTNQKTGIYTYTKFLSQAVAKLYPVKVQGTVGEMDPKNAFLHLQHEFGIFPFVDELVGERIKTVYRVATLHTVYEYPEGEILRQYYELDKAYDALIVHSELAKKYLEQYVKGEVAVIPHGSVIFEPTPKALARHAVSRLIRPQYPDIRLDQRMVFSFGFASDAKGSEVTLEVARRMPDVLFVISGAVHDILPKFGEDINESLRAKKPDNVLLLGKFLDDEETDLWASAADALLYNYYTPEFIAASSGALHRLLAAGKPIVATAGDARLSDLVETSEDGREKRMYGLLVEKDMDRDVAAQHIVEALTTLFDDRELERKLGDDARELAEKTSWKDIAKQHLKLYGKVIGKVYGPSWYDEEYFISAQGGKEYFTATGERKMWGYANPTGEWEGAKPVMEAIRDVLHPLTLLSVGEGRGAFVSAARSVGIDARGLDASVAAVNNPTAGAEGFLDLVEDVADLSAYPDGSYDMVFAADLFEHLYNKDSDQLSKAISEVQRVSRKWIFYNNGGTTPQGDDHHDFDFELAPDELPLREYQGMALAGHVTVHGCGWWEKKLTNERWRLRGDLVAEFRKRVDAVSPAILQNWECVLISEKVLIS